MTLKERLTQLEKIHAPQDRKMLVVIYGEDGRAVEGSSDEIIGMTREEITTLLNVVYAGAVFIPDNGRNS